MLLVRQGGLGRILEVGVGTVFQGWDAANSLWQVEEVRAMSANQSRSLHPVCWCAAVCLVVIGWVAFSMEPTSRPSRDGRPFTGNEHSRYVHPPHDRVSSGSAGGYFDRHKLRPCGPSVHISQTTVIVSGVGGGVISYQDVVWDTGYPGVPPGYCYYRVPVAYCYPRTVPVYYYQPRLIYFDPAAPLLRDLAAVTNRYIGTTRPQPSSSGVAQGSTATAQADHVNENRGPSGLAVAEPIKFRPSNEQQRALASRFLTFGDQQFSAGQYRDAYFKYKEAEKAAPDVAESLFRQGFALIATKQYELAFQAFRRGLRIDPTWPKKPFSVQRLYHERELDFREHLANLAAECEKKNHDPMLAFLLGVMLFRSGRAEDAANFFEIARSSPVSADWAALFTNDEP